jgi:transcriptional regulator with XRE-family HTH domain
MKSSENVLGTRIRAAREQKGWSQAELARQLRTSAYGVHLLEQGKTPTPRADRIIALARTLNVSSDYLLGLVPA